MSVPSAHHSTSCGSSRRCKVAEAILTRAIRGLGNAFKLTGGRSAPAGLELDLPAQAVVDLGRFAGYGSALKFAHFADGWVTANFTQQIVASVTPVATSLIWDTDVSAAFGLSQNGLDNTILWVYGASLQATASAQLTDAGDARFSIDVPAGLDLDGSGSTRIAHDIWMGEGSTDLIERTALIASYAPKPSAYNWPFPWPAGSNGTFKNENDAAAGTVDYDWTLLCRIMPMGVSPGV